MSLDDAAATKLRDQLEQATARIEELHTRSAREDHLKRVILGVRNVNQLIVSETDPVQLAQGACDCLTETLGYHNAWMALLDGQGRVWATSSSGANQDHGELRRRLASGAFPRCTQGALQGPEIVVVEEASSDCPDCPTSCGDWGRAGLSRQLSYGGRTWGVLTVSVPIGYARDMEEHALFEEVASDLGYALAKIEAEAESRRDKKRLESVIEGAGLGTWEWNVQTGEILINERWAGMLGHTLEELGPHCYETWAALLHPDDAARAQEALDRCVRGELRAYANEFRMRHKDGHWVWILDQGRVMSWDGDGNPLAMHGTHSDISETIRAEEALSESEERFTIAFRSSPAPLVLSEIDTGVFLEVNDRWAELLEFSREEQIGRSSKDVGIWESEAERDRLVAILRAVGRFRDEPINFRAKSGRLIPALWSAEVVRVAGRDAMLSLITDLTRIRAAEGEQARLAEQLNQAQRLESVGRLAGGVAHDYNNMLSVILGNAELLLGMLGGNDRARVHLDEICAAASRSADLTRQLLAFARKQVASPRVVNLNDVVGSMMRMIDRLIGEHIRVEWRPSPGEAVRVRIDPAQVDQILANLCINGGDAIGLNQGRIVIETDIVDVDAAAAKAHEGVEPGRFAVLSVRDDGSGMSAEVQSHIFEPFFTTKGIGEGTGLGLATVYGIVRQNQGFIAVESKPGEGTAFTIHLPEHSEADSSSSEVSPTPFPVSLVPRTVLVAEDESSLLQMISTMLGVFGYNVLAAGSPSEAIRIAEDSDEPIDLLLTDVVMPEMNGYDLATRLGAIQPSMKCLYVSGHTADVVASEGFLNPGVNFLQKPFTITDLRKKLHEVMGE